MNNNSATSRSIRALDDYIEGRLAIAKRDAETTYEEYPKMSSQEIEEGVKKERELNLFPFLLLIFTICVLNCLIC